MEYNELVNHVQHDAELASPNEAVTILEAVLGTLGEMLSLTERRHLGTQLPKPLKEAVDRWVERPPREQTRPHRFSLEEFYNRVAARSDTRYPAAVRSSQAVMKTLREAISEGELADIFRELPQEYQELLSGVPRGPVSPSIVQ